jgi:hypothetical protein
MLILKVLEAAGRQTLAPGRRDQTGTGDDIDGSGGGSSAKGYLVPSLPRPVPFVSDEALEVQIQIVKDTLSNGNTVGVCAAVNGMFGVGKSALAAEVVGRILDEDRHTSSARFPGGAAWISCDNLIGKPGLDELWERAARALQVGDPADTADVGARQEAVSRAVRERLRTVLVLDNIEHNLGNENLDEALKTLHVAGHSVVLLTSRKAITKAGIQRVELQEMSPPPAAALFLRELHLKDPMRPNADDLHDLSVSYLSGRSLSEASTLDAIVDAVAAQLNNTAWLSRIVFIVGTLPLVITPLASYAAVQKQSIPLIHQALARDQPPVDVEAKVSHSIYLSWNALSPGLQRLFGGLSLMARDTFPRDGALAVARAAVQPVKGGQANEEKLKPQDAIDRLVTYSLVEALPNNAGYRMHRQLRVFGAPRFSGIDDKKVQPRLGIAAVSFWYQQAKRRPQFRQMTRRQVKEYVSAQLRRTPQKEEWLDHVIGRDDEPTDQSLSRPVQADSAEELPSA